jgi:putative flippase GtrA
VKKTSALLNVKDLIVYFLVAGTGALVQFAFGSFFRNYMSYMPSVAFAYIVSFIVGFVLTKLFAFDARNSQQTRREMVKFGMVSAFSFFITVFGAEFSRRVIDSFSPTTQYALPFSFIPEKAREINVNEALGLLIAMGLSFISNYILHKTFTFRSTGFYDRAKLYLNLK